MRRTILFLSASVLTCLVPGATFAQVVPGTPLPCAPVAAVQDHRTYRTQQALVVAGDGTVYVGVEYKGVYRSTTSGATWERRSSGLKGYPMSGAPTMPCIQEMGRIVVDPGDPQHLYLTRVESGGTGTMPFTETAGGYETRDGGATWQQMQGYTNFSGSHALAAVRIGGNVQVYMGTTNMPASHISGRTVTYNTNGVLYRSLDAGATWTELDQRASGESTIPFGFSSVQVFVSSDGQKIWMPATAREANGQFLANRQFGFFESDNGGTSWIRGTARITSDAPFALRASDGDVAPQRFANRFLSTANPSGASVAWYTRDGVTWAQSGRYMAMARYSPHDATGDTLYGYDPFVGDRTSNQQGIYKSTDGGATWTRISPLPAEVGIYTYPEARLSHFAFHPTDPNIIYASANVALVYKSTDAGLTWTKVMDLTTIGGPNIPCDSCVPPSPPGNFQSTLSGQTVTGTWSAPTVGPGGTPSGYLVEVSKSGSFASIYRSISTVDRSFSYRVDDADLNVPLYFRISAVNQWGTSPPTPTVSLTVGSGGGTGGGGTGGGGTGGGPLSQASWTSVAAGGTLNVTLTTASSSTTWTASSAVAWLSVSPSSGTGSATLVVTAQALPGVETRSGSVLIGGATLPVTQAPTPDKPTALAVAETTGRTVTLRWLWPGTRPDSYVLKGGVNPGQTLATVSTGSNAPVFTFDAPQGAFYVRMVGVRGGAELTPSDDVRISVQVPDAPSAPTDLRGLSNGAGLELTWANTRSGGTPTGMMLDVTGSAVLSLPLPVTETFTFPSVPTGSYTFAVRALNEAGSSAASNAVSLSFPGSCVMPGAPEAFQAYTVGSVVYLHWNPPVSGTATRYLLRVTGPVDLDLPLASRELSSPAPPGTYTFTVAATNGCGTGPATAAQSVTVP